ncbi:tRNA (adenosine(37)-N6)-dimethylallyltransferase MiaA, partial [bacterium]|nr:tRNA (adenosine(37)-N6)-dimethylallyltransferase MiaA [bacterium]
GLTPAPPADPEVRAILTEKAVQHGKQALYQDLKQADPATAACLHPSDQMRIIRALEIFILTGERPSERKRGISAVVSRPACWLGIIRPREELYARAEQRIDSWIAAGWLEEIDRLLKQGVPAEAPAMQAIGYSHWVKHLSGIYSYNQAVDLIKRDSRRYIKRQLTWFKAEKRMTWVDVSKHEKETMQEIKCIVFSGTGV